MKFESNNGVLTVFPEGDLDAKNLRYISSAGLRVLLKYLRAAKGKKLVMQNVSRDVYDVLELTRFVDLMTVKKIS